MVEKFDESQLENSGWRLFQKWFQEYYRNEYPQLPPDYINNAVAYVIEHNNEIFTRNFVLEENLCGLCGLCCREIGCVHLNQHTNRCTRFGNREAIICDEYPYTDGVGMVFTLNCLYVKRIFKKYMDLYFTKAIEMMRGNNGKERKEERVNR